MPQIFVWGDISGPPFWASWGNKFGHQAPQDLAASVASSYTVSSRNRSSGSASRVSRRGRSRAPRGARSASHEPIHSHRYREPKLRAGPMLRLRCSHALLSRRRVAAPLVLELIELLTGRLYAQWASDAVPYTLRVSNVIFVGQNGYRCRGQSGHKRHGHRGGQRP